MGVKEDHNPLTVMPYKVNKSSDSYEKHKSDDPNNFYAYKNNLDKNLNSYSDNFEDVMKKTVAEINKECDESLQNETNKKEELHCNNIFIYYSKNWFEITK